GKIGTCPVITVAVGKYRKAQEKNNCTKIARFSRVIKIQRPEKGIYLFFHNLNQMENEVMSSQLQNCVDCGKALSRTATTCGNCSSTDPFGKKRRNDRLHKWFAGLFITATIIAGGLWYMGLLDVPGLLLR
ncbi:hypothetical protein JKW46_004914, partial [Escherichia coli]|nr:hypothetical protein [Escherichia coli]